MRTALAGCSPASSPAPRSSFSVSAASPDRRSRGSATIPRTASGKPDLNGMWQALNTANYDIQAHTARPAMAMRPGPVVPLPPRT